MELHTYAFEIEDDTQSRISDRGNTEDDSSDSDRRHGVPVRRTRTDVNLSRRNNETMKKYHSYGGKEYKMQHSLPSRTRGELLSSHSHHYGCDSRPSAWFNTVMARRRKGVTPQTEEEAVNEIAEAMEGDEKLMSDNIDGEIMRRETLRELSKPLSVKKQIRRQLTARRSSMRGRSSNISGLKQLKYSISMHWYKMSRSVQDTFHDYGLWHKDLKEVEGRFGTGVGSYFRFLRYLFLMNLFIAVIVCGFLLTPQLLIRLHNPQEDQVGGSQNSSSCLGTGSCVVSNFTYQDFGPFDWLTGDGWFRDTELFYGTYSAGSLCLVSNMPYDIRAAYLLVTFLAFVIYLIIILRRVIVLYKNNYIDTEHDMPTTFVKKIFSSWDFNIAEKKAASLKHHSIYNELTELLQEYLNEAVEESCTTKLMGWLVKLVFWTVIIGFMGLMGWLMYLMLDKGIDKGLDTENNGYHLGLLVYPLIVTLIIIIIPPVFEGVVNIEGYKNPRQKLYVTLVRTIMLELTILGVLVGFWYMSVGGPTNITLTTPETAPMTTAVSDTTSAFNWHSNGEEEQNCWETKLGQEIYRLLIIDFLVALVRQLATFIFYAATRKKNLGSVHAYLLEFNIARSTLHIIYNQTLLWAGLFFCPLTPVIVLLKITIMFYIQKCSVLKFMRTEERPWRAAQTETLFFALTLVSLILSFMAYGFIIVRGNSSPSCGPFQGCTNYVDFIWSATNNKQAIFYVLSWILKPGVVACILGILVILVYCTKSMAEGRGEMIKVLRQQLDLEVRDRAFLLQLTEKVKRGEYKRMDRRCMQASYSSAASDVS